MTARSSSRRTLVCRCESTPIQYIEAFREDAARLGLEPVEETPRATDEANLAAMTEMIQALERNGHTLSKRRVGLFQDLELAAIRAPRAPRS